MPNIEETLDIIKHHYLPQLLRKERHLRYKIVSTESAINEYTDAVIKCRGSISKEPAYSLINTLVNEVVGYKAYQDELISTIKECHAYINEVENYLKAIDKKEPPYSWSVYYEC